MITKNLVKALEGIGFTYVGDDKSANSHCYAVYGGYLVSAYEEGNRKTAYFSFRFSENEENAVKRYDLSEAFSNEMEEYSVVDYDIGDDGMRVTSTGNIPTFLKLIDKCVDMLIEHDIRGAEYCSVCGNKFGSRHPKKVTYGNDEHIMCEHCAMEALEDYNSEKAESVDAEGKVSKGVLGSILFALIGAAIYVALYYWLSPALAKAGISDIRFILCVTGAVVALLAYVGYRLFCKKISAAAYVTVTVTSLLFTAVGQYFGSVLEFVARNGFSLSVLSKKAFWLVHLRNTIPEELAESFVDNSATFYKLLAISLMFAIVCTAITLLTLRDKSMVKKEPLKIETIKTK